MIDLRLGDCLEILPTIADASIDAVICDPPYPRIKREYGYWTEDEWWTLIVEGVIPEVRRVLKPRGSAVFILQPNSRKVGSMRGWLWRFMAWACDEWNMVQDAWWWNHKAMPEAHAIQGRLMRPSVKACVWLGPSDCYRDQDAVLWDESDGTTVRRRINRARLTVGTRHVSPGGQGANNLTVFDAAERRGGVTPFNLIPADHGYSQRTAGGYGHGAGTPETLCDWWVRYISPPSGTVLDPFMGSGTVGLAALKRGRSFVGIERMPAYYATAARRLAEVQDSTPLFAGTA
jgi:DNA modification methylase